MNKVKPNIVTIRGRNLPVCSHGDCLEYTIWDYKTCWHHLTDNERIDLTQRVSNLLRSTKSLKGLVLTGADFSGLDFSGADLSDTFLNGCKLIGCTFIETDLRETFFGISDLTNSNLTRAELDGAVFSGANLENVRLLAYSISFGRVPINLKQDSFGSSGFFSRPHINESDPYFAEATYRALKAQFSAVGDYDSASWASYSERLMQRKSLFKRRAFLKWFSSFCFGMNCGYGEKPMRALISSLFIIIAYGIIYSSVNLIIDMSNTSVSFFDTINYSVATFTGFSYSDLHATSSSIARIVSGSESLVGFFQFGLFVFTLTKIFVAR
jgi:hypothetical protein